MLSKSFKFGKQLTKNMKFFLSSSCGSSTLDEAIFNRRSVRAYLDEPISRTDIDKIIEASRWAPSAKNSQPLKYFVISDQGKLNEISEFSLENAKEANVFYPREHLFFNAPAVVFVFWDKSKGFPSYEGLDTGLALSNMQLKAYDLGISSCVVGFSKLFGEEKVREFCSDSLDENDKVDMEDLSFMIALTLGKENKDLQPPKSNRNKSFVKYIEC